MNGKVQMGKRSDFPRKDCNKFCLKNGCRSWRPFLISGITKEGKQTSGPFIPGILIHQYQGFWIFSIAESTLKNYNYFTSGIDNYTTHKKEIINKRGIYLFLLTG